MLVVDTLAVRRCGVEVVGNPAVAFGRILRVDPFDLFRETLVILLARAFIPALPAMVRLSRDVERLAKFFDGVWAFGLGQRFHRFVFAKLACCAKASLLSSSFSFFRKSFSIWSR